MEPRTAWVLPALPLAMQRLQGVMGLLAMQTRAGTRTAAGVATAQAQERQDA